MNVRLVIFDCDGTLVDSEILGNQAFAEVLTEHGYPLSTEEAVRRFSGMKLGACLALIEEESGITFDESFESDFRFRMNELFEDGLLPVEGALSLVSNLNVDYCIASSGPKAKIEKSLRLTGLLTYFTENIYSSYDVNVWKPDPGLFKHIASQFGLKPDECVVVEDSLPGITAGVKAGMHVWAYAPNGSQSGWPVDITTFTSLSEIQYRLQSMGLWAPNKAANWTP